ncbi:MAG: O-antigen ligase family protein [Armatimonadota bacterium]
MFIFFLFVSSKLSLNDFELMAKTSIAACVIISVYAVFQFIGLDFIDWYPKEIAGSRPIGTLGNPIFLANFIAVIAPWSIYYYFKEKRFVYTLAYIVSIVVLCAALYLTFCRSGFLAFVVSLGLMFFLKRDWFKNLKTDGRSNILKLLILFFLLISIPVFIQNTAINKKTNKLIEEKIYTPVKAKDVNISTRVYLWKSAVNLAMDAPFTGHGPDVLPFVYTKYRYMEPVEIRGRIKAPAHVHNQILEYAVIGGIPLFVIVLLIIFIFFKDCFKTIFKNNEGKDILILITSGAVSYWVGNLFVFSGISIDILWYAFMGFLVIAAGRRVVIKTGSKHVLIALFLLAVVVFNFYYSLKLWTADYHYKSGLRFSARKNYVKAIDEFNKSMKINPYKSVYMEKKAKELEGLYTLTKDPVFYYGSKNSYLQALEVNALNSYAWADLGRLSACAGNLKESLDYYLQALKLDPYNPVILSDLATTLYNAGKRKPAESYYLESLSIYPYSSLTSKNLGMLYSDEGNYEKARIYLLKALEYEPDPEKKQKLGKIIIELDAKK